MELTPTKFHPLGVNGCQPFWRRKIQLDWFWIHFRSRETAALEFAGIEVQSDRSDASAETGRRIQRHASENIRAHFLYDVLRAADQRHIVSTIVRENFGMRPGGIVPVFTEAIVRFEPAT